MPLFGLFGDDKPKKKKKAKKKGKNSAVKTIRKASRGRNKRLGDIMGEMRHNR